MSSRSEYQTVLKTEHTGIPRQVESANEVDLIAKTTDPTAEEVFETVFGLRPIDHETYQCVRANPACTTKDLASLLDRDRSNVNRSLSALREVGMIQRYRRILESGGYFYEYRAVGADALGSIIERGIELWAERAVAAIAEST